MAQLILGHVIPWKKEPALQTTGSILQQYVCPIPGGDVSETVYEKTSLKVIQMSSGAERLIISQGSTHGGSASVYHLGLGGDRYSSVCQLPPRAQTGTWWVCGGFQASPSNDLLYNVLKKEKRANSDVQPHVNASLLKYCCLDLAGPWALKNPSPPNLYSVNAAFTKCIKCEGESQ